MRLTTFVHHGAPTLGVVLPDGDLLNLHAAACAVADSSDDARDSALPYLVPDNIGDLLRCGPVGLDAARQVFDWAAGQPSGVRGVHGESLVHPISEVRLTAPVPKPEKIIGIGLNYRSHADEQGARLPKVPLIFAKWNNTLVGAHDPIVHPVATEQLDYEAELAVVIGRRASHVSRDEAMSHVAGYMVFNDVTARDVQLADRQWVRGKTMDTLSPCGPYLVTADEVRDPHRLDVRLWLNDRLLQDGNTSSLIFDIPELVSFLSSSFTLEPGDVVATGTPAGVGFKREPPVFLQPGDMVRVEVEGLGELANPVVAAPRPR